ncbi:DNA mismatch repair endonuclease MutL [Clostridium sp. MB40-C1]|uniref:DNA mismatch repair endonuclease MutL n=1 Tax=Clostridium sp. MB40-C1 TaxID=3070996 RepID=UPI0027E03F1F|nr:DNA mismatch repair endonuclease MutL [Clostridium sp. MB40-C1]WMJ81998.1 DNA mismatch repair endonuclease MutL [Clostridium sp. MB40-C1]
MKRISILNDETSNKIAAGEVVERPASVVKELIENSIDAEAKNITIEIHEGGKNQIKVIDDGHGIHPDDMEKAFLPHGTSKISSLEDIYSINTFGFRGEALPSIGAVSSIKLKSRYIDNSFGKEISITGNNLDYIKEVGCNVGTYVQVDNIFFNVPARQKFLKSTQRESALISNIINRLALANHNISFKYYNNDKKSLVTFASKDVTDTIRTIYGKEVYRNIIHFEEHLDIASVYGYVGNAEISRGSRNNQTTFVNKRYIKSGLITAAVENAFKSFLTVNKYPFFVLFLDIYPEFIDVNVHPTKSEIKFENERSIYKLVFDTVHKAIAKSVRDSYNMSLDKIANSSLKDINEDKIDNDSKEVNNGIKSDKIDIVQIPIDLKREEFKTSISPKNLLTDNKINPNMTVNNKDSFKASSTESLNYCVNDKTTETINDNNEKYNEITYNQVKEHKFVVTDNNTSECKEPKFPSLKIIGQFNNTYILAEGNDEFYMIDQHAAHEKVLYEKYKKQIGNQEVISQILMVPVVLELNHEEFSYYEENQNLFKQTGFDIELFGDNTINIREAPMLLGKVDVKNFFLEILDHIKNMGSGKVEEVKWRTIASLACKAAIKANHTLSNGEMITLVETLRYLEEPFNCPHGRPTIIRMTLKDIEKKFKRIQ